jgi:CubicO group peptidase (beta-lactamase class C family)
MWVRRAERGQLLALGIHGQIIYMDSASECVIVKLSTQPEATDLQMFTDNFAAMDAVVAAL